MWSGRAGFTIPELLVVLIIVSVLSLVVLPRMEIVKFRMDSAARGYMSAMVAAQRIAVRRQHDVVVAFDTLHRRVRVHEDRNNNGYIDAGEPVRHVPLGDGVRFGRGPAPARPMGGAPVTFQETQDGMPAVRFIRNGSASEQGGFYLMSDRAVASGRFSGDVRAIELDRATGRVTWFHFSSPDWKQGF